MNHAVAMGGQRDDKCRGDKNNLQNTTNLGPESWATKQDRHHAAKPEPQQRFRGIKCADRRQQRRHQFRLYNQTRQPISQRDKTQSRQHNRREPNLIQRPGVDPPIS